MTRSLDPGCETDLAGPPPAQLKWSCSWTDLACQQGWMLNKVGPTPSEPPHWVLFRWLRGRTYPVGNGCLVREALRTDRGLRADLRSRVRKKLLSVPCKYRWAYEVLFRVLKILSRGNQTLLLQAHSISAARSSSFKSSVQTGTCLVVKWVRLVGIRWGAVIQRVTVILIAHISHVLPPTSDCENFGYHSSWWQSRNLYGSHPLLEVTKVTPSPWMCLNMWTCAGRDTRSLR